MQGDDIKYPPLGYLASRRSLLPSVVNTAMSSVSPLVPCLSTQNNRIQRLLWASVVISVIVFASSMASLGALTFWVSPATMALMTAFHGLVLLKLRKERRNYDVEIRLTSPSRTLKTSGALQVAEPIPRPTPVSITGKLPTAVSAWVLALLWMACLVLLLLVVGGKQHAKFYHEDSGGGPVVRVALEGTFTSAEIGLTCSIAYLCTREWRVASRNRKTKRPSLEANLPWHSSGRYQF